MANRKKALLKTAFVAGIAVFILVCLLTGFTDHHLDHLKHSLNLGSIVALVIVINIVTFLCLIVMFVAYRWIKKDLDLDKKEDLEDTERE